MFNFSFTASEKIMVMATVRALGFTKSVPVVAAHKKHPIVMVREAMNELESSHYLLSEGYVVKDKSGTVQYVELRAQMQPTIITLDYFEKCKPARQDELAEALDFLRCGHLVRPMKPKPLPRKLCRYELAEEEATETKEIVEEG